MDTVEIKAFYNSMLKKRIEDFVYGNERVSRATEEVYHWIKVFKPKSVLEIGCGIGDVSFKIAEDFPELEILGYDISQSTIDFGNSIFRRLNYKLLFCSNFRELKREIKNRKFDFIFLIDVFEHFDDENVQELIEFVRGFMNPNGLVFLSCPTINHQNYLRLNNPAGIQPVDRDISINEFLILADELDFDLQYFKILSVWNYGDYQHAVIGNIDKFGNFSCKVKERKIGIKDLIRERYLRKKSSTSDYHRIKERVKSELESF